MAALESQPRSSRIDEASTDLELVLADAYDAALEVARDLAPSLRNLDDVGWIEQTIETLPMVVLRAATGPRGRRRDALDHADGLALRLRVAIEVLDGLGALGAHPTRIRARACGIQARLRDASRSL